MQKPDKKDKKVKEQAPLVPPGADPSKLTQPQKDALLVELARKAGLLERSIT